MGTKTLCIKAGFRPEAYTPGALGVRRAPFGTEHDVTFSRSCDQRKITKNK